MLLYNFLSVHQLFFSLSLLTTLPLMSINIYFRASRVSLDNIQKTLKQMDTSIKNLKTDLTNNRVPQSEDDKFLEVMEVNFTENHSKMHDYILVFFFRNLPKMLESNVMSYKKC